MSKRVALIVDNPQRDLPGLVLVAFKLCQHGLTCYLVPFNLQNSEIWPLAPDFVLLNYLRRTNEAFAKALAQAGIRYGFLDTEGGVMASVKAFADSMAQDSDVRNQVACFCSWGPYLAEHACQAGWYSPEQVFVTGTPRLDFYAQPWRQVALDMSPYADRYNNNLILLNGIFALANPRFQTPEAEVEMYVRHFGRDRASVLAAQQGQRRVMEAFVAVANRLARRFPNATFVYRPHPFERLETYCQLLEPHKNLHLVQQGTVDGWILRARALVQFNCSTAIEAGIAGVPALTPAWISPPLGVRVIEDVSLQCGSEDELADALEAIMAGRFQAPASIGERLAGVIHDWFYQIDGRAHERVAAAILQSLGTDGTGVRLDKCRDFAYGLGRPGTSLRWRARATLGKALGLSVHWSFRRWGPVLPDLSSWDNSGKYFDARQVRILVDAIQACAREHWKGPLCKVGVHSAQERGDYHFGYLQGRSVVVFPE